MQSLITDGSKEHHSIALLHEIIGQVGISNHMRKSLLLPAGNMARKSGGWGVGWGEGKFWNVLYEKKKTTKLLCSELNMTFQVHLLELVLNFNQPIN